MGAEAYILLVFLDEFNPDEIKDGDTVYRYTGQKFNLDTDDEELTSHRHICVTKDKTGKEGPFYSVPLECLWPINDQVGIEPTKEARERALIVANECRETFEQPPLPPPLNL